MKKFILIVLFLLMFQNITIAKDSIEFVFPNEGWHKVDSPDGVISKKCFVPHNQTASNYVEMVIFTERILKNKDISPITILQRQLGKDRLNYSDIEPEYIKRDFDDAMITWCSKIHNTCAVKRAFQGKDGVIVASYINKMPHYSQNIFGQWSNILGSIKINKIENETSNKGIINL